MSKRIGYIDAMRGFTMILVVYSHVCGFCLGDRQMALNDVQLLLIIFFPKQVMPKEWAEANDIAHQKTNCHYD